MNPTIARVIFAIGRKSAAGVNLLGTGFAVTKELITTPAHVTGPDDTNLCAVLSTVPALSDYQDTTVKNVQMIDLKLHRYDPIRDICLLTSPDGIEMTKPYTLSDSDSVLVGSPVATIGYPHADHGRLIMTEQRSTVGARVLLSSQGIKTKNVVLNVQCRPGQSGSPVLTADGSKVVAMVLGSYAPLSGDNGIRLGNIDPQTLHQTTHAISARYISELLS